MGDTILMDRQIIGATEEKELVADSADASTLVDAALSEDDDFWNGFGAANDSRRGHRPKRRVREFDSTSDTITVDAAWDAMPAAARPIFWIGRLLRGIVPGGQLRP